MTMKIRQKVNPRTQKVLQVPRTPVKEEGLRANDQEKCSWGPDCLFVNPRKRRGREQATAAEDIAKNTKTTGQKT